jgi:hypothetical protein
VTRPQNTTRHLNRLYYRLRIEGETRHPDYLNVKSCKTSQMTWLAETQNPRPVLAAHTMREFSGWSCRTPRRSLRISPYSLPSASDRIMGLRSTRKTSLRCRIFHWQHEKLRVILSLLHRRLSRGFSPLNLRRNFPECWIVGSLDQPRTGQSRGPRPPECARLESGDRLGHPPNSPCGRRPTDNLQSYILSPSRESG